MARRQRQTEPSNGTLSVMLLMVVSFAAGYFFGNQPDSLPRPDDQRRQVTPDDGKGAVVVKAKGFLYFVQDNQSTTIDELNLIEQTDAFCKQQQGLEVRVIDTGDPSEGASKIRNLGEQHNVSPPYVLFRNTDTGKSHAANAKTIEEVKKVIK